MSTPTAPATGEAAVRIALAAVLFSSLLLAGKLTLAWITGSTAILSDAIETFANVLTSAFAAFAAWLGSRPRDADHPYGHGKVEYFSVALEGVLLTAAAFAIAIVALPRLAAPPDIRALDIGAIGMAVIAVITLVGARFLVRKGRSLQSPALEADGQHLLADAVTSAGVFVGIGLVHVTGLPILDPIVALVLAAIILVNAVRILRKAIAGLMDEADPVLLDDIARVLEDQREPGWLAPHLTRVHRLGQTVHIDLHLVLPRYWSIDRGHDAANAIEKAMQERFGHRNETMVHMEPCTPISCPYCDVEDCPVRDAPFTGLLPWTGDSIRRGSRAEAIAHTTGEMQRPTGARTDGTDGAADSPARTDSTNTTDSE